MAYKTMHYVQCDFCSKRSHPYGTKKIVEERVFGTDAIYPWKVMEDKKHKCNACLMVKDK